MPSYGCADKLYAHRGYLLRFGPPILVQLAWWTWALLDTETRLGRFTQPTPYTGQYYYMSITMVIGSLVAGATSEGGGAVAFPVMTLLLSVPPVVARDFSFGIQSFGMSCASLTIFGLGVPLDYEALIWSTIGGILGLVVGLVSIAPFLSPAYAKLFFVCVWLTFALALFKLNSRGRDRRVYQSALEADRTVNNASIDKGSKDDFHDDDASDDETRELSPRLKNQQRKRAWVLFSIGCFGGICSSIAGSGLDIATFSILTLYFRVSEKVATPTSVILMATNAILGVFCRTVIGLGGAYLPGQEEAVWSFVSVCIPIVVIGAPIGSTIASKIARHWLAYVIYVLDVVQFISAFAIIQPWSKPAPENVWMCLVSVLTLVVGTVFFFKVASWGNDRGECELHPRTNMYPPRGAECDINAVP